MAEGYSRGPGGNKSAGGPPTVVGSPHRMPRSPMPILSALASVAAAVLAGCGSEGRESARPAERGPEFFASALENLDKAEDLVRQAVLANCDKWQPRDRPCDPEQVRRDQLECWID